MRVHSCNDSDTPLHIPLKLFLIGFNPSQTEVCEDLEGIVHDADGLNEIEHKHRLHNIQLQLTRLGSQTDRMIVPYDLKSHLIDDLCHNRVNFTRHN
ncbi:hypothetical protein D3C75_1126030 [compost metagenome]